MMHCIISQHLHSHPMGLEYIFLLICRAAMVEWICTIVDRSGDGWNKPINMGPVINTPENESFPFAAKYGKLFFASDGHRGYGGKDLYYTQEINEDGWPLCTLIQQ